MDIIIITSSRPMQAEYWQQRIATTPSLHLSPDTIVIGVHENWPDGAGNGLGTLYAFQQAQKMAKIHHNHDLFQDLKDGASISIYHTAGLGKRLSPLTAVEGNNKPAVKLPCEIEHYQMSIIDAVIKQSLQLSPHRRGRVSVFWGDQLFLPDHFSDPNPAHISVVAQKRLFPTPEQWKSQRWDHYGIMGWNKDHYLHLDKVDYETAKKWAGKGIALSLGTFSFSSEMIEALLEEFAPELEHKTTKMDVEPHLFMPMTLNESLYVQLMGKRGVSKEEAFKHYLRMQHFLSKFGDPGYTIEDIGPAGKWWDFGCLDSYYHSLVNIVRERPLYDFLIGDHKETAFVVDPVNHSLLINCKIKSGNIYNSVLYGVQADNVEMDHAVAINVCAPQISCKHGLLYNSVSESPIVLQKGAVRADLFVPEISQQIIMNTRFGRDGKEDWNKRLAGNLYSYEELEKIVDLTDHMASEEYRQQILQQVQNRLRGHIFHH